MGFLSHTKHGRHKRIMTPSSCVSSGRHTFALPSTTFEGVHQVHSKFTEGHNIIIYKSYLNLDDMPKKSYGPF